MRMWSVAAAVWVAASTLTGAARAGPDALAAIDACTDKLNDYDRIAARCPELLKTLEASAWSAWLPPGWHDQYDDMSASSLASLRVEVARELALRASARAPQLPLLRPILVDLAARHARPPGTWWERLRRWLRSLVEPEPADEGSWFERFGGHVALSQTLLRFIAYVTLALVLALAALIVFAEWRATGASRGRAARARADAAPHAALEEPRGWLDVERAPAAERPRVLLGLILARLIAARRLPPAGALTVRQLARTVVLNDAADRERLAELACAAELLRYSLRPPSAEALARALRLGRELLERLAQAPAESHPRGERA
jgi:hypothetical protein